VIKIDSQESQSQVIESPLDMATLKLIAKKCFPKAIQVTDRSMYKTSLRSFATRIRNQALMGSYGYRESIHTTS
jgi:hypothetical protein